MNGEDDIGTKDYLVYVKNTYWRLTNYYMDHNGDSDMKGNIYMTS